MLELLRLFILILSSFACGMFWHKYIQILEKHGVMVGATRPMKSAKSRRTLAAKYQPVRVAPRASVALFGGLNFDSFCLTRGVFVVFQGPVARVLRRFLTSLSVSVSQALRS